MEDPKSKHGKFFGEGVIAATTLGDTQVELQLSVWVLNHVN